MVDGICQIMPVRQIRELARERNIQAIVDGALAFGHMQVDVRELGCDYYGTSLHKWLSAPLGTGLLYVKGAHVRALPPLYGSRDPESDDIRKFEDIGTAPLAPYVAVGPAIDF